MKNKKKTKNRIIQYYSLKTDPTHACTGTTNAVYYVSICIQQRLAGSCPELPIPATIWATVATCRSNGEQEVSSAAYGIG